MFTAFAGRPEAETAASRDAVWPWVGTHTSQRPLRTSAVQFIGSIQACARNGASNARSTERRLVPVRVAEGSPLLRAILPGFSAIAAYCFMISALLNLARGPSSHFTSRACTPFVAD